jgi:hypothetical protein
VIQRSTFCAARYCAAEEQDSHKTIAIHQQQRIWQTWCQKIVSWLTLCGRLRWKIEMNNLSYPDGYSFFFFFFFKIYIFMYFILCDVWWFWVVHLLFYSDVMHRQRSRNGPILRPAATHKTNLWKITSPNATFCSSNVSRLLWVSLMLLILITIKNIRP